MSSDIQANARRELTKLASMVTEPNEGEAASRLLEKITGRPEPAQLRDALVLIGASEVIREARAQRDVADALDVGTEMLREARWSA